MVLTDEQIKDIIINPRHAADIKQAIAIQNEMKIHVTGEGYEDALARTMGKTRAIEFGITRELRQPITLFLTKKIKDELSRWKNTQGTRKSYDFGSEKEKIAEFRKVLDYVWRNSSIQDFAYWANDAVYTDFNGFVMVEVPSKAGDGFIRDGIVSKNNGKPYIIFKAIEDVHDFECRGRKVEYLVLNYGERAVIIDGKTIMQSLFRVIDDAYDRIYVKTTTGVEQDIENPVIENTLKYVPAIQLGDILSNSLNSYIKVCPFYQCQPHLNDYMVRHAEHVSSEVQHAYPLLAIKGSRCTYQTAEGAMCSKGKIMVSGHEQNCPRCNGTGFVSIRNASEIIVIPELDKTGKQYDPGLIGQYIVPPTDILEHQAKELDDIESTVLYSGTGIAKALAKSSIQTATEIVLNIKPLEDKISSILDNIETVESFVTNCIGTLLYREEYKGCEIHYGRKLNIRDENLILNEIEQSKRAGMPVSHIRTLLQELIATRNRNSKVDMERGFILLDLEPMATYSIQEVLASEYASRETKCLKMNFDDFIDRFEVEHGPVVLYETEIDYAQKIKDIKAILDGYNAEMLLNVEVEQTKKDDGTGTED